MRLIDADALKDSLVNAHINRVITFDINTFRCVMNCIDNAPTVDTTNEYLKGYLQGCKDTIEKVNELNKMQFSMPYRKDLLQGENNETD